MCLPTKPRRASGECLMCMFGRALQFSQDSPRWGRGRSRRVNSSSSNTCLFSSSFSGKKQGEGAGLGEVILTLFPSSMYGNIFANISPWWNQPPLPPHPPILSPRASLDPLAPGDRTAGLQALFQLGKGPQAPKQSSQCSSYQRMSVRILAFLD